MNLGIGVSQRSPATAAVPFVKHMALAISMSVASTLSGQAAEPAGPNRYSESGMLDAARAAAGTGENRSVNIGVPPPDELRVLEARREADLKRLSEKLKRAEARAPQPAPQVGQKFDTPGWTTDVVAAPAAELEPGRRSALGAAPARGLLGRDLDDGTRGRATILLVLAPRETRYANPEAAADPILCVADGCYVSNGAQAPATYHSFKQSVSLGARLGRGAGDCNHSLVCVFRDVDLGSSAALVQPVDLKMVRHDKREQSEAMIDSSCRVIDGRLSCSRPVRTGSYTMWVVPEHVARDIGPEALANAATGGLRTSRTAELPWVQ